MKLVITLLFWPLGSHTSYYHTSLWLAGPQYVCRDIQDEFLCEYVRCPTTPDAWKEVEREFRVRWHVPHAIGYSHQETEEFRDSLS